MSDAHVVATVRRFRRGQGGPLVVAMGAAALLLGASLLGDNLVLEIGGTAALLTSYVWGLSARRVHTRPA